MKEYGVIIPIFNQDITGIDYFYDQDNKRYENFDELLKSGYLRYYILDCDIVYSFFENWASEFKIAFKLGPCRIHYGSNYVSPTILQSNNKAPKFLNARGSYEGRKYKLLNLNDFIRNINYFSITEEKVKEAYEVIGELEKNVYIHMPYKDSVPNSLAALARSVFPKPSSLCCENRLNYMLMIKSSYKGGLYYLKEPLVRYKKLYNYDIRSLYPFILVSMRFPNPKYVPEYKEGFVEVNNSSQLAIYHIKNFNITLKKERSFHTQFTIQEEQQRLQKFYKVVFNDRHIYTTQDIEYNDGWLNSIDLLTLKQDYEIEALEIDATFLINELVEGKNLFSSLKKYYKKKEEAPKGSALRTAYKILIDSYSGSLGHYNSPTTKRARIGETDQRGVIRGEDSGPIDLAGFVNAYGRYYILNFLRLVPNDKLVSIDTDGFWTTEPIPRIDMLSGDSLGDIRLDKVMYDAVWYGNKQYVSREDSPDAPFTPHIAGLPAFLYEENRRVFTVPQIVFDSKERKYKKITLNFALWQENQEVKDETENIIRS